MNIHFEKMPGRQGQRPNSEGRPLSALYFRDFRLFWTGQFISFSGTWMHSTAQGWLIYSITGSPLYLGLVAAASSLPILFLSLIGGAFADRFRKRNLLLLTQGLSVIPPLIIGLLTSAGLIEVWHVVVLVTALGVVNAFDMPARQAFLLEMVEEGHLLNAVALNSAAFNGARIIGPVVAGLTIAYVGLPACFYMNALSFIPVIIALSRMKAKGEKRLGKGIMGDIAEGMSFLGRQPRIFLPVLLVAAFSFFGVPFITLLPVFATEILGVGAKGLGFLAGSAGVGAFAAAMLFAIVSDVRGKEKLMGISSAVFALSLMAFSRSTDYHLSMALLAVVGFSVVSLLTLANGFLQLCSPDALRGRVMSVYTLVLLGMAPIGNSIMGVLAEKTGTANAVTAAALICLLSSLAIFAFMMRERVQ